MRTISLILLVNCALFLNAQSSVQLGGMSWSCAQERDYLVMKLYAPTTGWLGVGFNHHNNIVHSDLLLFNVRDGQVNKQDMYVRGIGDPQLDSHLGGSTDVEIIAFEETAEHTFICFRRPYQVDDRFDFSLVRDQEFWLILAYSIDDDFRHHSRMRQHQKVVFKPE